MPPCGRYAVQHGLSTRRLMGPAAAFSNQRTEEQHGNRSLMAFQQKDSGVLVLQSLRQIRIGSTRSWTRRRAACTRQAMPGRRGLRFPATIASGGEGGISVRLQSILEMRT